MRVLVVLPFPVHIEGGAGARVAIGLLRGLRARGVDVRALSADGRYVPEPGPPPDLGIDVVHLRLPNPARERAQRFVLPFGGLASGAFAGRLREAAADVDVVHIVERDAGSLLRLVDRPVVAQLDCATLSDRDFEPPWTAAGRTTLELVRAERRVTRRAEWILASSPEVANALARGARGEVVHAPLALDGSHYAHAASLADPVAVLIGTAGWPPTRTAVARLLTRIWPLVLESRPEARLRLAGRGMTPDAFAGLPTELPGVEWFGEVASATDFLRSAGLLLYPIERGSGGKVKVIESLALGVPVVTGPCGAEGLVAHDGVSVEHGDDGLAAAAAALIGDLDARRRQGAAGRANFDAHHAPVPATGPVVELYERMLGRRSA